MPTAVQSDAATSRSPGAAQSRCARAMARFELADHKDCAARGLNSAGFAVIDLAGQPSTTVRFKEPVVSCRPRSASAARFRSASKPGCSISTTRSTRITSICGSRWTSASAIISPNFSKVTQDEAFRLQKDYYRRYGTSMRGLMTEHGMTPDDFLDFVHEIDHSPLEPNPALGAALEDLPGRKLILTNGTRKHADAVMRRLDIHDHFEDVFDIIAAELEPKPLPQTYERFLARHGVDPPSAAMFEDLARNLEVPHALGMTTVLVVPEGQREVFREDWELEGRDAPMSIT